MIAVSACTAEPMRAIEVKVVRDSGKALSYRSFALSFLLGHSTAEGADTSRMSANQPRGSSTRARSDPLKKHNHYEPGATFANISTSCMVNKTAADSTGANR